MDNPTSSSSTAMTYILVAKLFLFGQAAAIIVSRLLLFLWRILRHATFFYFLQWLT
jgi:hypothetical protein